MAREVIFLEGAVDAGGADVIWTVAVSTHRRRKKQLLTGDWEPALLFFSRMESSFEVLSAGRFDRLPEEFVQSIQLVWLEDGKPEEEQVKVLDQVRRDVSNLCEAALQLEKRELEKHRVQITGLKATIELLARDVDAETHNANDLNGMPAMEQVKVLQSEKDRLLVIQDALHGSLEDMEAEVIQTWVSTLGEVREKLRLPECLKAAGRKEALQKELKKLQKLKCDRQVKTKSSLARIRRYLEEFNWRSEELKHNVDRAAVDDQFERYVVG